MKVLLALLLFCPELFGAYTYYRSLTIDHTLCGSSDSSNFPVLVSISNSTFKTAANGGHVQNTTTQSAPAVTMPADLIFATTSAGTTKLPWEVEFYDAVNGILIAWVQLPTVSHTANTVFYVLYGNSSVTTAQNTGSYTPQNVWNSYGGVWHLPSITTIADSTGNIANCTNNSTTAATGQMDGAAAIAHGTPDYINCGNNNTSIQPATSFTWESWFNPSDTSMHDAGIMTQLNTQYGSYYIMLRNAGDTKYACGVIGATRLSGTTNVAIGTWAHIACSLTAGALTTYVNGLQEATTTGGSLTYAAVQPFLIGGDDSNIYSATGTVDEVRVGNLRSADWILTEYNNQNAPGNIGAAAFITYGTEFSTGVKHKVVMVGF